MTSRERLLRLFKGEDIDHVPIWLLFPYFPSGSYANVWEIPSYKSIIQKVYECTDTIDRRGFNMGFCYNANPDIHHEHKQIRENDSVISQRITSYKDIQLKSSVTRKEDRTIIEPLVKDIGDLSKILAMPYQQPKPQFQWFFDDQKKFGEHGLMAVDIGDPLGVLHGLCGEMDFVILCYTETQAVINFLDVIAERVMNAYRYLLENNVGDIYWIVGSEFAGPPMLPPKLFDSLVVRYNKPLIDMIHSYGKKAMIHYHGNIGLILKDFAKIGLDAIHTIESPPMGDCTLTQAREEFGKDVILTGNIQIGDLWSKTEEEMEYLVKQTIQEGMKGAFILSTTGGPYAPEIPERVANNYLRIIDTAMNYGIY
jgi:uroporphyrinogen-III decarboxylase